MLLSLYLVGDAGFMVPIARYPCWHFFSLETGHMVERHQSTFISLEYWPTRICQWMTYCWCWSKFRWSNRVLPYRNEAAISQLKALHVVQNWKNLFLFLLNLFIKKVVLVKFLNKLKRPLTQAPLLPIICCQSFWESVCPFIKQENKSYMLQTLHNVKTYDTALTFWHLLIFNPVKRLHNKWKLASETYF